MASEAKRAKAVNSHFNNAGKWKGAEQLQRFYFYTKAERLRLKVEVRRLVD